MHDLPDVFHAAFVSQRRCEKEPVANLQVLMHTSCAARYAPNLKIT